MVTSSFCSSFIFSCAGSSLLLAGFVWLPQAGAPLVGVPGLVAAAAPPVQSAGSPSWAQYRRLRLALVAQCRVGPSWTGEDWQADASPLDPRGVPAICSVIQQILFAWCPRNPHGTGMVEKPKKPDATPSSSG